MNQIILGGFPSLAETLILVGIEGAAFLDYLERGGKVENVAGLGNTLVVHDVKFSRTEGSGNFVFHHAHTHAVANDFSANLDGLHPANVKTNRSVELQRHTASGRFGVAVHRSYFLAQLVSEDHGGLGLVDRT